MKRWKHMRTITIAGLVAIAGALGTVAAMAGHDCQDTPYDPMLRGDTTATSNGWTVDPVFTVGESVDGYQPVGILDGIAAYQGRRSAVRVLVNHELGSGVGKVYELDNGTRLTGARISFFDVDKHSRTVCDAGPAYGKVYDRYGNVVTQAQQINEGSDALAGFDRFCSSAGYERGEYGFRDAIYLTGEETSNGTLWALDVDRGELWACPAIGRGAWENVTALDTGNRRTIALLLGDDTEAAPLYLWIGRKSQGGSFLERNGLANGQLFAWASDAGDANPGTFNGFGATRTGEFVAVDTQDVSEAGNAGYDAQGYLDDSTLRAAATTLGAFQCSRPEDLHTNPEDGTQAIFASTGRPGFAGGADSWGTIYLVEVDLDDASAPTARLTIVHDADDLLVPDEGIRSPDNLTWARNGYVYVQEDRSIADFGAVTGIEASVWQLDPWTLAYERIAEMDRSVVAPAGTTDSGAGDIGNWESSGVLDVTPLFKTRRGETLLIAAVQAHGIRDGVIGGNAGLVQGGQLVFLSSRDGGRYVDDCDHDDHRGRRGRHERDDD